MYDGDTMVKIAYAKGLVKAAEDAGMDKEAIWGAIARGLGALGSFGAKLWGAGKAGYGIASKPIEGAMSAVGRGGLNMAEKVLPKGVGSHVMPYLKIMGGSGATAAQEAAAVAAKKTLPGMARTMVGFGAFSGGINALSAEPGHRGEAFAKGFAGGALGGAAWHGASNLLGKGLTHTMSRYNVLGGAKAAKRLEELSAQAWHGPEAAKLTATERLKGLGAQAVTKALPFAGAWYANGAVNDMGSGAPESTTADNGAMQQPQTVPGYRNPRMQRGQFQGSQQGSW